MGLQTRKEKKLHCILTLRKGRGRARGRNTCLWHVPIQATQVLSKLPFLDSED